MESIFFTLFILFSLGYLVFALDDFWVDSVAWIKRLFPKHLSKNQLDQLKRRHQKRLAIIVPAWKEAEVIQRMLCGNIHNIQYHQYDFFVGVYPNDMDTVREVEKVSKKFKNVHAVVNTKPGPTSKGQILNTVLEYIWNYENQKSIKFEGFLMQDAEDIIHPLTPALVNVELASSDFIQIPVFSLEVSPGQLVAGTYMDEFAESHTKDLLVREYFKAAIPSAGVGTGMSRKLVQTLWDRQGHLFNEKSQTEDYELGHQAHLEGFKSTMACYTYTKPDQTKEFIATREFFPKKVDRSMRQKTRWTLGISLQSYRVLGWQGGFWNRYFLYRDRKGLFLNPFSLAGYVFALCFGLWAYENPTSATHLSQSRVFIGLTSATLFFMIWRLVQRMLCTYSVYGFRALWTLPLRWPLGVYINARACLSAVRKDFDSRVHNKAVAWVKTDHELPAYFGATAQTARA